MAVGVDLAQMKNYLFVYIYPPVLLSNKKKKNQSFTFGSIEKQKLTILTSFFYFLAWALRLYILGFPC